VVAVLVFFAAGNFYPDFILWIFHDQKQYITFMDTKGLRNMESQNDSKIEFYKKIKDTQALLADQDTILNSFILSVTSQEQVQWKGEWTKADFNNHHIFFQNQKDYLQQNTTGIKRMIPEDEMRP
jgi:hypothetical protein